jgi:hypothetical protein
LFKNVYKNAGIYSVAYQIEFIITGKAADCKPRDTISEFVPIFLRLSVKKLGSLPFPTSFPFFSFYNESNQILGN